MCVAARRHPGFGWIATLLLASLPLGAAHAVELVQGNLAAAPNAVLAQPAVADSTKCPPPVADAAPAQPAKDSGKQPVDNAGGGATGIEPVPRWKTLLPGALR